MGQWIRPETPSQWQSRSETWLTPTPGRGLHHREAETVNLEHPISPCESPGVSEPRSGGSLP
eukprot:438246-Hanusia_phi.AAC.1